MDAQTLDHWRDIIIRHLDPIAAIEYPEVFDRENRLVIDRERDEYMVVTMGWEEKFRRVHGCLVHVEIRGDKVWIQTDGTENGIASDLVEAGIPRENIVLGYKTIERRQMTGFAAA